ncbi:hypothetical protein SARC_07388 [Sphaeroforma arctica JP610]|uniref:Uncharacterized protein n=1 Tax=Sphaeroforma arctica JP610 TaxID=667725 RepID=A0A0L0FTT9_9EUKA|nr:hypothetical protein SARC_07388 [Sphaeroforma arctica JP610]KNC80250.1 hypothetical protein SARC_07388 [Sphaeroforma arctica JP610]|eukprot:XP_014154152.1 hypothetical protein SARC_07388 [Sphaeroforma arctica JP610]
MTTRDQQSVEVDGRLHAESMHYKRDIHSVLVLEHVDSDMHYVRTNTNEGLDDQWYLAFSGDNGSYDMQLVQHERAAIVGIVMLRGVGPVVECMMTHIKLALELYRNPIHG